jgi:bifunctional non-homologous end joining protein LigD
MSTHPGWLFELKYDGFRALAYVDREGAKLVPRRNLAYRRFEDWPRSFPSK